MFLGSAAFRLAAEDIITTLPEGAARRLQNLRLRRDEAAAIQRALTEQVEEQRQERLELERQLALLQAHDADWRSPALGGPELYEESAATAALDGPSRGNARLTWVSPSDGPSIIELKGKINRLFGEMKRFEAARAEDRACAATRSPCRRCRGLCAQHPRQLHAETTRRAHGVAAQGPEQPSAIENRRRRLREIASDIAAVAAAPTPANDAKRKIIDHFEMLRTTRAPSIERLLFGGELELSTMEQRVTPIIQVSPPILLAISQVDVEGLLAYALGDVLQKKTMRCC